MEQTNMEEKPRSTISWLWEFASPHKNGYIISLIFATLGAACSIAPYFCVAQMVLALLRGEKELRLYGMYCLLTIGFWILRYLFHAISTTLSHEATFAVLAQIRSRLTKKLTRLPMGYLLDTPSGQLKNVIVERVDSIETTLAHVVPEMGGNVLVSLATILYLFVLDWRMALAALIPLPIGLLCYLGMTSGYGERFAKTVDTNKRLNDTAVEYIGGIEVIKAFNQSASSYKKFTTAARAAADSFISWMRSTLPFFSTAMSVFPAVLVSVLPIGTMLYMRGSLPLGTFITSIIVSLGIMGPLVTAMSYSDDIAKIGTIIGEVANVLTQRDLERPSRPASLDGTDIRIDDVTFAYGETPVLRGVKSTIAKLIASLWDVDGGAITIGGIDIRQIPLEQLNSMVAYVSQDNYLFDETIRENIRMGCPSATDAQVEDVARKSGCHEFIERLEHGYDTRAGGSGGHLSGGERQRVAIARAMLKNAPIIILDEATAYTDPENEAVIQEAVSKLVEGKTLIVIAHRLSTITDSDNIAVIENGRVAAQGTHETLLTSSPLYKTMWMAHTAAKDDINSAVKEVVA
jgi:ATP-binding cassette subfamily B protein